MKPTVGKYTIFYTSLTTPFLIFGFLLLPNKNTCMAGGLILSIPTILLIVGAMCIDGEERGK